MLAYKIFDYKKFEDSIVTAMEHSLRKWANEYDDIYILSLDCARDMTSIGIEANTRQYLSEQADTGSEDYWYYKYCEAEWELYDAGEYLEQISSYMRSYTEENEERFTNPETFAYLEAFDEHCDTIIETCKKALKRFRQAIHADFPDLLLTFNIGEYLDHKERTEIFASVNSKDASEEYAEHIDDFN
ncbi:MAG: DUF4303 domain-containing protein [Eubacterium sp.]|nr:DUF4303 domain-containing protein [Eubacterium sp.]